MKEPKRIIAIEVHDDAGTWVFSTAVADDLPPHMREKVNDAVFFLMENLVRAEVEGVEA